MNKGNIYVGIFLKLIAEGTLSNLYLGFERILANLLVIIELKLEDY